MHAYAHKIHVIDAPVFYFIEHLCGATAAPDLLDEADITTDPW